MYRVLSHEEEEEEEDGAGRQEQGSSLHGRNPVNNGSSDQLHGFLRFLFVIMRVFVGSSP